VHAGALASAVIDPDLWQYGAGAVLASQASLFGAGLWPGGQLLGPNWTRLPRSAALRGEIAITFDDGPDPDVTPAVLDILDQHAAKATFFCIGHRAMACASLCRDIVLRGHAVENHSLRHHYSFACSGYRSFVGDLAAAQDALFDLTGERPRFFRAPFGFRNPLLDPALSRLDLRLASWTRRGFDTRSRSARIVLQRLERGLKAGDILLLHDGNAARTLRGHPVVLDVLPALLTTVAAQRLRPITLRSALE
jgi:peptidoglycan/xylan/chitin deacetylase (PgdA/CDA1 family)